MWFNDTLIKELCKEATCGICKGLVKEAFNIELFDSTDAEEIQNLKQLALSVVQKSPQLHTPSDICNDILRKNPSAIDRFCEDLSPEAVTAGVGIAAQLVCKKSFRAGFAEVLTGACLNLVGC